jgi:hypothetical protein
MASQWDVHGSFVEHLESTKDWSNLSQTPLTEEQKNKREEARKHRKPRPSDKEQKELKKLRKELREKRASNDKLRKEVDEGLSETPISRMTPRISEFLTAKGSKTKRRKKRKSNKKRSIKRKHSKRR